MTLPLATALSDEKFMREILFEVNNFAEEMKCTSLVAAES